MNTIETLKVAVKFSRNTGYFLHDIRNPDLFVEDQISRIIELDKAFIAAANILKITPEYFAGFGESNEAMILADKLSDELLIIDDAGMFSFRTNKIYEESFPEFRSGMVLWMKKISPLEIDEITKYWSNHV